MPSRQYAWQQRMRSECRCRICGKPAINAQHCEKHRALDSKRQLALYHRRRRFLLTGERGKTSG